MYVSANMGHGKFLTWFQEWESFLCDAVAVSEQWCDSSTLAIFLHQACGFLKTKSLEWLNHAVGVLLCLVNVCNVTAASAREL